MCRDALTDLLLTVDAQAEYWATVLVRECGSLPEINAADEGRLRAVAPDAVVDAILSFRRASLRLAEPEALPRCTIQNFDELLTYLRKTLGFLKTEQVQVLYFGPKSRLLSAEVAATGSIDRCVVHARELIRRALQLNANALVLAHNHPSGIAESSKEAIVLTRDLIEAGRRLGIVVHDHVVISRTEHVSLRARGMI